MAQAILMSSLSRNTTTQGSNILHSIHSREKYLAHYKRYKISSFPTQGHATSSIVVPMANSLPSNLEDAMKPQQNTFIFSLIHCARKFKTSLGTNHCFTILNHNEDQQFPLDEL